MIGLPTTVDLDDLVARDAGLRDGLADQRVDRPRARASSARRRRPDSS